MNLRSLSWILPWFCAGCFQNFEVTTGPSIVGLIDEIDRLEVRSTGAVLIDDAMGIRAYAVFLDGSEVELTEDVQWQIADEALLRVEQRDDDLYYAVGLGVGEVEVKAAFVERESDVHPIEILRRMGELSELSAVAVSPTGVRLSWKIAPAATDGHKLVLTEGAEAPSDCSDENAVLVEPEVGNTTSSVTIEGLTPVTEYSFRVCGYATGQSPQLTEGITASATTGHRVFVSSLKYKGDFGAGGLTGVQRADAKCQVLANAASLDGVWGALLSTSTQDLKDRITVVSSLYNMRPIADGGTQLLAEDAGGLWDGELDTAILYSEKSTIVTGDVWTGSTATGATAAMNCNDWSSALLGDNGGQGAAEVGNSNWLAEGNITCDTDARIYCIDGQ